MQKDFTRDNVNFAVKSAFCVGYKPFAKKKKTLIKLVNELLVHKKVSLIPKKDLAILNTKIIEFADTNIANMERGEFYEKLTDFIVSYCQAIIREQNIINFIYK